jgi:two-component system OmpR family sensor kinase
VTAAFAATLAVVLLATGFWVYRDLRGEFTDRLDDTLSAQSAAIARDLDALPDDDDLLVQVLAPDGTLLRAGPDAPSRPVVDPRDLDLDEDGDDETLTVRADWDDERLQVRANVRRVGSSILVVGSPLEDVGEPLGNVRTALLIGLAGALVLASLAGWLAIAAALRPVERMRREAAAISGDDPSARLPTPPADDELGRLAGTLNDMLARLGRAVERERDLVADASHELRTPLAILTTELELALERDRPAGELRDALRSAQEEVRHMTRIAEDLLLLARSDRGELPLAREDVDVAELLADVAARFAHRAAPRMLAVDAAPGMTVRADRARLGQALGNLVDNALVHGAGEITLSAVRDGAAIELAVADEGPGFPDGFAGRAFDRFARADEARGGGGAGLGLAIVALVASAHGGTASIREGARVVVTLPVDG